LHSNTLLGHKNDKNDIKNRAQTAREDARKRHGVEKATLAFSRVCLYSKSMPCPSAKEESLVDKYLKDMAELSLKFTAPSSSFGSTQHVINTTGQSSSGDNTAKIFELTLQAIRVVHVRRTTASISGTISHVCIDNYKVLLKTLRTNHTRRPFVMLDRLHAMLAVKYQAQERKLGSNSVDQLDSRTL
jgi:hypothetical protein